MTCLIYTQHIPCTLIFKIIISILNDKLKKEDETINKTCITDLFYIVANLVKCSLIVH